MDRPKWYSKLINMAVVLSVVLSLVGLAVLPVASQPALNVVVETDYDEYCYCDDIYVTANITNSGNETAVAVNATISWDPPANATNYTPLMVSVGDIPASGWATAEWTLHCEGSDVPYGTEITVNATEYVVIRQAIYGVGSTNITQYGATYLTTTIFTPEEGDTFTQGDTFPLKFQIENTGTAPALHVNGTIFPSAGVAIAEFGCDDAGMSYTTGTLPRLDIGESYNWTVMMQCCDCDTPPLVSSIHVVPNGDDYCTGEQTPNWRSDIVRIHQVYNVSCNATPNPSKVCHNVTFTATLGECAVLPISGTLDWGDGTPPVIFGADTHELVFIHHYNISGNHTAVINVTDDVGINGTCQVDIEVFPPLSARCMVEPYPFTKLCHNLTFNGTAVGGFPDDLCGYNWTWDLGDGTVINGTGYSSGPIVHHYNWTGNFTATFMIEDDCMNNTANCSMNITIFPPLDVSCNVSSNVTKVGHNVTFCGEAINGIPNNYQDSQKMTAPPCTYNWTWEFFRDGLPDGPSVSGDGAVSCISYGFNETGNYTAVFTIQDNCWNNTATCNETVEVFPGLNLTCDAGDSTVCNAVNFTATLSGGVPTANYTWTWDFGDPFDPTPAHTQNATHTYMCTGNYTATVTVCDDLDPVNCANCTVNVTITIEPPELYWPGNGSTVTVGCNNTVCLEWEDIGCCNYTVLIWKEIIGEKVWTVHTGKDAFACIELFDLEGGWKWQVIAVDMCGEWVVSDVWHFDVERDCMYADVDVTRPNGGETFTCNTTEMITWEVTEYGTLGGGLGIDQGDLTIDIYYSIAGGAWIPIAMGEENDGAYGWFVPEENSNQVLVKVRATDAQGNVGIDVSDSVFTIECAPPPTSCTTLYEGWNLYGTPLIPDNTDITNITAAINDTLLIIWSYNASDPDPLTAWRWYAPGNPGSTLDTIQDGVGYWFSMNMTDTLCIEGQPLPDPPAVPPTYEVVPGWNLIGYKAMVPQHHSVYLFNLWSGGTPNYSIIWGYDGSVPEYLNIFPMEQNDGMLEPGHGYWLWATVAGTIVPTS